MVFGEDAYKAREILHKNDINEYNLSTEFNFLEFHPKYVPLFADTGVKIGLSYYVTEFKEGDVFLRELKIKEITEAAKFDIEAV